jgi:fumarate reductase flavoprotein subunit
MNGNSNNISRRDFLKGSALGATGMVAAMGTGSLTACAPETPVTGGESGTEPGADFRTPPDPIEASAIDEIIESDVVIAGGGLSGFAAAVTAAERGARVVLLEKRDTFTYHGLATAIVGSGLQKELGLEVDMDALTLELERANACRADMRVVNIWRDHSGEAMDWLMDLMAKDPEIIPTVFGFNIPYDPINEPYHEFPTAHLFNDGEHVGTGSEAGYPFSNFPVVNTLVKEAESLGVDIRYETPAIQLIKEGDRVTGVIAQAEDGSYLRFNADKGVVLACGDYGNSSELMTAYQRADLVEGATCDYVPAVNTGDGHKMGLWVGAAMDTPPHCVAAMGSGAQLRPHSFLRVNPYGERITNEDNTVEMTANTVLTQPGYFMWQLLDADWPTYVMRGGMHLARLVADIDATRALVEEQTEHGVYLKADTLDELAELMDVPADTLKATVSRYNELAARGHDDDFGVRPDRMFPVVNPPFLAGRIGALFYVTLGGLKVNHRFEVLDEMAEPISGLYAAGNTSGSFYGVTYYDVTLGNSHGRALATGWAAGQSVAGKPVVA